MKHAKLTTITPQPDGTTRIETESYHEQLASVRVETEQHIQTTPDTFLSDIVTALKVVKDQKTQELTIKIKCDERYLPRMITKVWTVKKESFKKR